MREEQEPSDPDTSTAKAALDTEKQPARRRRSRVLNTQRLSKRQLYLLRDVDDDGLPVDRPRTRGDCVGGERPCPYVRCEYHLYLDVKDNGSIILNYPDKEVADLEESCALDVADQGGKTLEEVGDLISVTRERARQIEAKILLKLKKHPMAIDLFGTGDFYASLGSMLSQAQEEE